MNGVEGILVCPVVIKTTNHFQRISLNLETIVKYRMICVVDRNEHLLMLLLAKDLIASNFLVYYL